MQQPLDLRIAPEIAYEPLKLQAEISDRLGIDINRIRHVDVRRRSIDARQRKVMINLSVVVYIDEQPDSLEHTIGYTPPQQGCVADKPAVIVVGAGPAGLFASLKLIELGYRPIVLERGKSVDERSRDMARIAKDNIVDPESNYCFGEGGAGAYSDGKLYTRSKKRGSVDEVLRLLVAHGASPEILVDAHPHIGTDRLPKVIRNIRQTIINAGGEVHFSTRVDALLYNTADSGGSAAKRVVTGVKTSDGRTFSGPVILATGHSARDVYRRLKADGLDLEPKGIAVGVRLEHPQKLIDRIQYHNPAGRGKYLPPAEYSMLTRVDGRAVYSFCMCPGGFIIPAATGPEQLVVNGMSPASRGTRWANSGMVVEVLPDDLKDYSSHGALKVMVFQEEIEKCFSQESNGLQNAPAQRMCDFVNGKASSSLPESSYAPGIHSARIDLLLPDFVARRLQKGFAEFGKKSKGFLTNEAVLIGSETRTSSPVRIPRHDDTLQHVSVGCLYPCGEGAGYAGGIVSAAIDGIRCAVAVASENKS